MSNVEYTPINTPSRSHLQPPRRSRRRGSDIDSTSSKSSGPYNKQGWAQTKDILNKWAQFVHSPSAAEQQQRDEYWSQQSTRMGKTIILPVRVEPKVQFANERTFLNWMHFAVVLTTISVTLLNYGDKTAQTAGLVFTFIAVITMLYGLSLFLWRGQKIRNRLRMPYDDLTGPTALGAALILAMFFNFVYRAVDVAKQK